MKTVASYDFTIEFKSVICQKIADRLSPRPCIKQNCAHWERLEKTFSDNNPGMATSNIGVMSTDTAKFDERRFAESN